jgi:3-hydroxymyristoyl/3-hydroxydecanoyl-(acyl carrier protein) dehydratase
MLAESLDEWIKETRDLEIGESTTPGFDLSELLSHRSSMLLLEKITKVSLDKTALAAQMSICQDNPIFEGHFPGNPVYPGVLLIEAISQAGVSLIKIFLLEEGKSSHLEVARVRAIKVLYAEFTHEANYNDGG